MTLLTFVSRVGSQLEKLTNGKNIIELQPFKKNSL